jgi:glycine cleavage system transcriptional repressor
MKKFFLLSAFGKDRPGMVAAVTKALFDLGGNIEDASMTRLGGEFSIMLIVSAPASVTEAKVQKALTPAAKKLGLQIAARPIQPGAARPAKREEPRYMISVYGTDRSGIVHEVTQALAERKVSITDLNTKAIHRGGKPIYVMLLEVQVPPTLDIDNLRDALDRLRQSLDVEISFQDIDVVPL